MKENEIVSYLQGVRHPGRGDKSIVELGMVDSIEVDDNKVTVTIAFQRHRDPLAEYLIGSTKSAIIRHIPGAMVEVRTVIKEDSVARKTSGLNLSNKELDNVRYIIGVASGKGGVGKSTVAVNLAVSLATAGYKVGLADADVYGPSVPKMTGTEDAVPEAYNDGKNDVILPFEKYGVKWMSIGYFAKREQALVWRGPMACNALKQMILQVHWGELDFLLIDMPPGTGDIHLSLVQDIPMTGAIIVSTPQAVALADVEKGVSMFRDENIRKPIIGLVENMSWFTPAELPENRYYIFGKNGGAKLAEKYDIPLLGQIPLVQGIRESGDEGQPAALSSGPDGIAFAQLAENFIRQIRNLKL